MVPGRTVDLSSQEVGFTSECDPSHELCQSSNLDESLFCRPIVGVGGKQLGKKLVHGVVEFPSLFFFSLLLVVVANVQWAKLMS